MAFKGKEGEEQLHPICSLTLDQANHFNYLGKERDVRSKYRRIFLRTNCNQLKKSNLEISCPCFIVQ